MKLKITTMVATTVVAVLAIGQAAAQDTTIHSRSNLVVASSANMTRVPPAVGFNQNDLQFMKAVAGAHIAEIKFGQLAQARGGEWAKGYGKDMEREHTLAFEQLKQIAKDRGVALPTDFDRASKKDWDKLNNLHGWAFDSAYRKMMLAGHRAALNLIHSEMSNGRDEAAKGYAVTLETAVKEHLRMAQEQTTMVGPASG
jgi:putative membrane protein